MNVKKTLAYQTDDSQNTLTYTDEESNNKLLLSIFLII
jgi:hypothetical protein